MSDKKLLNENTIRRFMKLANVDTMTDNFISEMGYGNSYKKNEKELEETTETTEEVVEEATDEEVVEEELDLSEQDEEELDMGDEMDMDMGDVSDAEPMGEADISLTEEEAQLLIDLGDRLKEAMTAGSEEDMVGAAEEPEMEEPEMEEEEEEEEDEGEMMQEEIVNEVLKRVTQRIIREKMKRK